MNNVYGNLNLTVSVPVEAKSETLGLLEANYKYNDKRFIAYKVVAIDHDGSEREISAYDGKLELDEFILA
ncbi:hypothetical protein KDN24_06130 [Bacillus sp. Bva_UNVM-123]|uniref:hypothetical protein n=1 Tax=Bacillus sp. Bva_UNVM-123 TaxID=2829798 RepID=UPI00391F1299